MTTVAAPIAAVRWADGAPVIIDQRLLPGEVRGALLVLRGKMRRGAREHRFHRAHQEGEEVVDVNRVGDEHAAELEGLPGCEAPEPAEVGELSETVRGAGGERTRTGPTFQCEPRGGSVQSYVTLAREFVNFLHYNPDRNGILLTRCARSDAYVVIGLKPWPCHGLAPKFELIERT